MERETPSSLMYADLKQFGHVSNRDAAKTLLSKRPLYGGVAPADRVDERTFLSREVVHAEPDSLGEYMFCDFRESAQILTAQMLKKVGGEFPAVTIISHYANEGREAMCAVLRDWKLDSTLYSNVVEKLLTLNIHTAADRATLLVLLFCATGSLGDPKRACELVESFANDMLGMGFRTVRATVEDYKEIEKPPATESLGLARIVDGRMRAQIHPLDASAEGTVIGSLVTSANAITDVDVDVSRRHARVWCEGGRWFLEDLNSTNGTQLISGADKSIRTVSPGMRYELLPSDVICLGTTTRFMVLALA